MKKVFLTVALLFLVLGTSPPASAATLSFPYGETRVVVNGKFDVSIRLDPRNEKIYTVKAAIFFPSDILEVDSFHWNWGWIALPTDEYDQIDGKTGLIIKSAGLPLGTNKTTDFATITFRVKASGAGTIRLSGESLALNNEGLNSLDLPYPSIAVIATAPAANANVAPVANANIPAPAVTPPTTAPQAPLPGAPAAPQLPSNAPTPLFDVTVKPNATQGNAGWTILIIFSSLAAIGIGILIARRQGRRKV